MHSPSRVAGGQAEDVEMNSRSTNGYRSPRTPSATNGITTPGSDAALQQSQGTTANLENKRMYHLQALISQKGMRSASSIFAACCNRLSEIASRITSATTIEQEQQRPQDLGYDNVVHEKSKNVPHRLRPFVREANRGFDS